jgi:hypothetical protein
MIEADSVVIGGVFGDFCRSPSLVRFPCSFPPSFPDDEFDRSASLCWCQSSLFWSSSRRCFIRAPMGLVSASLHLMKKSATVKRRTICALCYSVLNAFLFPTVQKACRGFLVLRSCLSSARLCYSTTLAGKRICRVGSLRTTDSGRSGGLRRTIFRHGSNRTTSA